MVKQGRKERGHTPISPNQFLISTPLAANEIAMTPHHEMTNIRDRSSTFPIFDVHSPFFLHSADHLGLSIVTHVLDGTNYNNWSIAMRMSLDAKNKLSFVDGSLHRPDIADNLFKIWSRCNSMVKAWLLNVVNKEIYDSIMYYEDAVEMWNDLYLRFRVSNLPRKYQLEQSTMTLKQENLDLSTYYTKKKTLWVQLANTRTTIVKRCSCDHVKEMVEEVETSRIIQFLMGLNESFANIRGQILNMKPRPGLTEIYNMLDQDESQRSVGHSLKSIANPSAFQIRSSNLAHQPHTLLAQAGYQKPKCSHCHKMGHIADKCYKLHGYPPGSGPSKWKKPHTIGSTNLATLPVQVASKQQTEKSDQLKEDMSGDQIQTIISYLSSKLHGSHIESLPDKSFASTSHFVLVISQVSGTYTGMYDWSR